jgi:hypothetical protein
MTRGELDFMIKGPADAGRQFEALAAATQVDVHRLSPEVLRQATWACMRCACRAPCKRWLRSGVWEYGGDSRCPNAEYCTKPVSIISAGAAWSIADGCPHPAELGRAYPAAGG